MTDEKVEEEEKKVDLEERVKEQEDKYLRLLAEMENLRKRLIKEKSETIKFAKENVISEFLIAIDNFENALGFAESAGDEVKNWAKGFEMILGQFKEILSQHGIVPFESVGKKFDPHRHEAVETEESAEKEGTVLEEFLRGYIVGDRVLRAARVKVAKAKKNLEEEEKNDD